MSAKSLDITINANGLTEVSFRRDIQARLEDRFNQPIDLSSKVSRHIHSAQHDFAQAIGRDAIAELSSLASLEIGEGITVFYVPYDPNVTCAPRPGMPASTAKSSGLSERIQIALSQPYGFAAGVKAEGVEVISNVAAVPGREDAYTGEGGRRALAWHSENSAWRHLYPGFDLTPRMVSLNGVSEQKSDAPVTLVANVAHAVRLVNPENVARLRSRCGTLLLPYRHRRPGAIEEIGPVPILFGAPGREECCGSFYPGMIRPVSVEHELAIAEFVAALDEVAIALRIVPGVCVTIVNGAVLHSRVAFPPAINEHGQAERWLQRLFTYSRPEALMHFAHNGERVFDLTLPA